MLLERLRRALAADYEVLQEIAGGGMGVVFAARQRRLDRIVAIKVLRPEFATAIGAERFQAEGRVLAQLTHPNIIPIYDAGEADGLLYFAMEFIEGETLAQRIARGPLPPNELIRLARDLLSALGAAHVHGVVHRDVKPANIFLREGQALLGDFGIARGSPAGDPDLTAPGHPVGTPRYMSPDRQSGEAATPGTDVYSAALVLYEASSGVHWPTGQPAERGDWSKIPAALVRGMHRALALDPVERWPDANAFLATLEARRPRRWPWVAAAVVIGGMLAYGLWPRPLPPPIRLPGTLVLSIAPFEVTGSTPGNALGDSVAHSVMRTLSGYIDLAVVEPAVAARDSSAIRVDGFVRVLGDSMEFLVRGIGGRVGRTPIEVRRIGPGLGWPILADSIAGDLLRALWTREEGGDPLLPRRALPKDTEGLAYFWRAERSLAEARWEAAAKEYTTAEQTDSTCYLCSFRLLDIDRWMAEAEEPQRLRRLAGALDSFPPHYQALIRAALISPPDRLELLRLAVAEHPDFFLAPFEYGDELFHRGPLFGELRRQALEPFERTVLLRPRFSPGWEHKAWLLLSEGDAASAREALDSLQLIPLRERGFSASLRMMLQLGYHWRFLDLDTARTFSRAALREPGIRAEAAASAGARLMMTADAPRGAVELGGLMVTMLPGRSDAVIGGLLGQMVGYAALGRLDSLRMTGRRFAQVSVDHAMPLLALELEAVLRAFDPDTTLRRTPELDSALQRYRIDPAFATRSAWALGLLAVRSHDTLGVQQAEAVLLHEPAPSRHRAILRAAIELERGDPRGALADLPDMPTLDTPGGTDSPMADAVVRLLRAEAEVRLGNPTLALHTLRWHEHMQIIGHLTGAPQAGEMGWAVGTLVRWLRAGLLDPVTDPLERCSMQRAVARLWAGGEEVFAARAAAAQAALSPDCGVRP